MNYSNMWNLELKSESKEVKKETVALAVLPNEGHGKMIDHR